MGRVVSTEQRTDSEYSRDGHCFNDLAQSNNATIFALSLISQSFGIDSCQFLQVMPSGNKLIRIKE